MLYRHRLRIIAGSLDRSWKIPRIFGKNELRITEFLMARSDTGLSNMALFYRQNNHLLQCSVLSCYFVKWRHVFYYDRKHENLLAFRVNSLHCEPASYTQSHSHSLRAINRSKQKDLRRNRYIRDVCGFYTSASQGIVSSTRRLPSSRRYNFAFLDIKQQCDFIRLPF